MRIRANPSKVAHSGRASVFFLVRRPSLLLCFPMGGVSFLPVSPARFRNLEGYIAFSLFTHLLVLPRLVAGRCLATRAE
jgi:hypothetical protein